MTEQPTIFDRFGGVRPMADVLGEAPSTVQSWKAVGRIPASKQPLVLEKAEQLALGITPEDVIFPMGRPARCVETDDGCVSMAAADTDPAPAASSGNAPETTASAPFRVPGAASEGGGLEVAAPGGSR